MRIWAGSGKTASDDLMPTGTYNKKYLRSMLGSLTEEQIERAIDELGMNIESKNNEEIEVEFQANRPDLISTVGLARAIKYFTNRNRSFAYALSGKSGITVNVRKETQALRPFIACMVVKNVNFTEASLLDLIRFVEKLTDTFGRQRKKVAIGLHDASKIQGPITYGLYADEEFEALDIGKAKYSEVLRNTEKGRAYADLCVYNSKYCALKDSEGTMALIPVLNSERTKISIDTKELFVDVTGTNEYNVNGTANLLACNFIDMGFDVYSVTNQKENSQMQTPKMEKRYISIKEHLFPNEIGVPLAFNNIITLANKMGLEAALVGNELRFSIPPYRLDIINDQDVIEDIAVAYGYDYIQPLPIVAYTQGALDKTEERNNRIREIMTGLGFSENMSSYLTNEDVNFAKMKSREKERIQIANSKTSGITMLRTWLLPSLLLSLSKSQHEKLPHKLFELDMVFKVEGGRPVQYYDLACVISDSKVNFNDIKAVTETLSKALEAKIEIKPVDMGTFIEKRCGVLFVEGKPSGVIGELHPEVLANFGIKNPAIALELELKD